MRLSFGQNACVIALAFVGGCSSKGSVSIERSAVDAQYQTALRCAALVSEERKGFESSRPDVARRLEGTISLAFGRAQGIAMVLGYSDEELRDRFSSDLKKAEDSTDIKSAAFDLVNSSKGPTEDNKIYDRICGFH
jgi:hypothetical protein